MLKLFVGDVTEELANYASRHGESILVTKKNYKKIIELSKEQDIIAHTSHGDFGPETRVESTFFQFLLAADEIIYVSPTRWSDHSDIYTLHSMQRITEYYLYDINIRKNNVKGLRLNHWTDDLKYLKLYDNRKSDNVNLWISGCSITHGEGVESSQRYGQLLANKTNLPVSFLTKGGSCIEWAADQILRSDIRPNDIVVWGLTSEYRTTEWENDTPTHINPHSDSSKISMLTEETRLYKSLLAVNQVTNFCCKINAKLILFPIISSESLRLHLCNNPCYVENLYQVGFIDIGTDGVHPGPVQHKIWADYLEPHLTL